MTKRKFLEELGKRLNLLEESEKQDILNEYKDIIEEKVKHGKTEKEAIVDFGSIDELSKEILSAYKINYDYVKNKQSTSSEKAKEIINNSEGLIKEGARKLSDFTRNLFDEIKNSNNPITVEMIFEIVIKAIIMLVGFVILRIPFWIIRDLGSGIFDMAFVPFDRVLIFIWSGIISVLYFVTCVVIGILVFKQYFRTDTTNVKKKKKLDKIENDIEGLEKAVEEIEKEEECKASKVNGSTSVIMVIVKAFVIILFLIPLFFINFGLITALVCIAFLLYKGLNVIGLIAIIVGLIIIFGNFGSVITRVLFERKRIYFFPFIIGVILLITGGLITIDKTVDINYYDSLPYNSFEQKTVVYHEEIDIKTHVYGDDKLEMVIDDSLEDGKVDIEVIYYRDIVNIEKKTFCSDNYCNINFDTYYKANHKKKLLDIVISELKKDRVYNYGYFFKPEIKITANQKTMKLID